ncbi:MAG TPA: thioredoxin domain-containing protein [Polyangia bacterium]
MSSRLRPPVDVRDHRAGSDSASLTLVEYGDYECPFCGEAHAVVKALQERLGARLRFVFRNFPLASVHPHALVAAEAAEAADAQGLFWPMHNTLYEHQDALEPPDLVEYAARLGLDLNGFESDLRGHRFRNKLRADLRSGAVSGVNGTPTFFINGYRHDGSFDFDTMWRALAGALAQPEEFLG